MVLRIEDTDLERSEARFEGQLLDDLKWMGIDWDEGPDVGGPYAPYRQSDRLAIYREHAERLVSEGKAYLCFCSQEELERDREEKLKNQLPPIYSGKCRALDPAEAQRRRASGEAAAIRLRIPEHPIRFHDIVHGPVEFASEVVSDPIILRSSGIPVYNYVVVVDDALMKITHVIRGDDHLSNTPKQVALYEALGWPVPEFAHLSTILGSDRERLSKRHGATSIANFREMGVLPEALMNYLALLGWAPSGGTREIFSPDELKKEFSLERVTPSPAVFDMEKLYWLNRHYIKQSPPERIEKLAEPYFVRAGLLPENPDDSTRAWFSKVVALLAPSVDKLEQLPERAALIFRYDAAAALQSAGQCRGAGRAQDRRRAGRVRGAGRSRSFADDAGALQGDHERGEGEDRREGQRPVPSRAHRPDRIALRAGVRQADSDSRGRLAARSTAARDERTRAAGGVSSSKRISRCHPERSEAAEPAKRSRRTLQLQTSLLPE